ncbi:MAG: hypothetical protein R2809_09285 [Flavobacteriales bacterium]
MKKLIPFILGLMLVINSFGQSEAPHKVVMQVTANDTWFTRHCSTTFFT